MTRKLPVGIQSFEKLRRDGYVYVDKTAYVYRLAHEGAPFFLIRPRRFGKSLLVSTMRAYFEGRRDLFEGLAIEELEGDGPGAWQARPVFHFDFTGQDYRTVPLEDVLGEKLSVWEQAYGFDGAGRTLGFRFQRLLELAHERSGHRCAVLVDEYDKPLLDVLGDEPLLERNRGILKGFYSVLKGADEHLRFAFITGVTKFSKVSIFSDLNQLADVSLERDYAAICGVTEDELLRDFGPELDALAGQLGMSQEACLAALRDMYDGYCFHPDGPAGSVVGDAPDGLGAAVVDDDPKGNDTPAGQAGSVAGNTPDDQHAPVISDKPCSRGNLVAGGTADGQGASVAGGTADGPGAPRDARKVYNPFSLLRALQSRRLGSYWFETGTPTFLAMRMKEAGLDPKRLTDGSVYATERRLSDYRADDPDPVPLLFQAGYLTIRGFNARSGRYELGVPNGEVEWGLVESLLPAWAPGYSESRGTDVFALWDLVEAGDTDGMRDVIAALFASIPYTKADDPYHGPNDISTTRRRATQGE